MIKEHLEIQSRFLSSFGAAEEQLVLIASERGFDVVRVAGERICQFRSIEHGQIGAFAREGGHQMCCISEQSHARHPVHRCPTGSA